MFVKIREVCYIRRETNFSYTVGQVCLEYERMIHQGNRSDLTGNHLGITAEQVGRKFNVSGRTVSRYIRLGLLDKGILDFKDNYKNTSNLQYKNIKDLLLNGNISPEETEVLLGMYFEEYLDMSLRYFGNSEMQNIFKEIEVSGQGVDIPLMSGENSKLVMRLSCTDSTSLEGDGVKSWTTELYFSEGVSTDNSQGGLLKVITELGVDFKDKISKEDYPLLWNLCAAYYNWQETDEEKAERIDRERLKELESELSSLGDASLFDVYTFLLRNWSVTDSKYYEDAWIKNGQNSSVQAVKNLASIHCDDIVNNQNYTVTYDDGSGTIVLQKVCSPINVDNSKSESSKTSVTSEQYLRLRLMYDIIQTSKSGKSSIDIQGITASLSNKGITGRLDINNSLVVNRVKVIANANQAATDMSNVDISELGEIDYIDILNRAEELTRYFIPRVQGYVYDTGMEVIDDESVIRNSSALFGLFPLDGGGKLLYVNSVTFIGMQLNDLGPVNISSNEMGAVISTVLEVNGIMAQTIRVSGIKLKGEDSAYDILGIINRGN